LNDQTSFENHVRPIDVVLIARDVIQEYQKRTGEPIEFPVPILNGGILDTISTVANIDTIDVECLKWPGDIIKGCVARYQNKDSKASIWYSSSLNTCWSRFVICKEAAHLLIGDDKNYTTDPVALVNGLIDQIPPGVDEAIDAENLALYCAMELLIPKVSRDALYKMENEGLSDYEIAYELKVPEQLITVRLNPQMRKFLDDAHDNLAL